MSNGRLVVEAFAGGAILPVTKEVEGVHKGVVELGHTSLAWLEGRVPAGSPLTLTAGGLTAVQTLFWRLMGGGDELAAKVLETYGNVEYINALTIQTAEVWAHSRVPLNSMADIKGWKCRQGSAEGAEIFGRLGAAPVVMPGSELYEAASRGVIDGFEYLSPAGNWAMSFQEVTDYVYLSSSRAPAGTQSLVVNKDAWAKLTPDLKAIVESAARQETPYALGLLIAADSEAILKFIEYGNEVLPLPKDIEEELGKVAAEYYSEKAAGDALYREVIESRNAFKELCELQNIR